MANLPRTKKAHILAGLPASQVNGVCRYEAAAGQVPSGGFGRPGKSYEDLTVEQHINIVFGFSGQPSDAPQNVVKLRRLRNPGAGLLGKYLERFATELAIMSLEDRRARRDHWMLTGASLLLDPDEGVARISYIEPSDLAGEVAHASQLDDQPVVMEFRDPDKAGDLNAFLEGPHRGDVLVWRRQPTEISLVVLIVVAELLAEGIGQHGDLPPQDGEETEASQPESENAPDRPGSEAPVRENQPHANAASNNQPHANAARPSNSLEATEVGIGMQSHSVARMRHPFLNRKDALHHAEVTQA